MLVEERRSGGAVAIADLAQHSTRPFVNEVLSVVEQQRGDRQSVGQAPTAAEATMPRLPLYGLQQL